MDSIDLSIIDDDLVLNQLGEPELRVEADCIAQDLRHMLREKGYAFSMIGERSQVKLATLTTQVEIEMENDTRIYPGTAKVALIGEALNCSARTLNNEAIEVTL
ncbi:MAG: DUF2590 family protein [Marinomonas sp.]